ncbi:efflux RND transporter periplasmic adaptor subunit [Alkalilacustris brevis]|uniref:efflux RND transporter periplasmic adaptor subunit n=1 Tax=Alkalilacustris brevis TaxID=2026338 RepID=UPI000E0DAA88|nr:HlyD family efflux transporter periplasmic adaptor subunit [Alkalilacustris brevis]
MNRRVLWLIPALVLGVGIAVWLVRTGPEPTRFERAEVAIPVQIVTAEARAVAPVATGYGLSRPARSWSAVASVRGTIIETHPDLSAGRFITAGAEVLKIDPSEYELALAEAQADLASLEAEAAQLDAEGENLRVILALERERLTLAEQDLRRTEELVAQGTAPQARLDEQQRATLAFRRTVQELENTLALLPVQQERLEAQMARTRVRIARAERDLEQTTIKAPFDMRVTETQVEAFQFVNAGQPLLTGEGVERAEIVAQIPVEAFRRIVAAVLGTGTLAPLDRMHAADMSGIDAEVRLIGADVTWPARVEQVQTGLDARTRTVQVVLSVDAPYDFGAGAVPLVANMYLGVALTGPPLPPSVQLPDAAVHGGRVLVMGADDRLELRAVEVAFRQQGQTVLRDGVAPGERVVLTDVVPAIAGTLLRVADGDAAP